MKRCTRAACISKPPHGSREVARASRDGWRPGMGCTHPGTDYPMIPRTHPRTAASWDGVAPSRDGCRPRTWCGHPGMPPTPGRRLLVARRSMPWDSRIRPGTRHVLRRRNTSSGAVLRPTCSEINVWTFRGGPLGEIDASEQFWNASNNHSIVSGADIPSFLVSAVSSRTDGF